MGTRYSAVFFAPECSDFSLLAADLFAAVDRIDRLMSTWKPDSDLNRLNAARVGDWVAIPREPAEVLSTALDISRASNGAFDIGVGDLVRAWGFGPGSSAPDPVRIAALAGRARPRTTSALELDRSGPRARKHAPLSLDLSGIAKGYGVDEMARVMEAHAVPSYLVGIDGELRAKGLKPDGSPWAVGLERPERGVRAAMGVIELTNTAVATSGNYRHCVDLAGRIVSHTMDPRRAAPVQNGLASVSALAATCMEADAWASALLVLGEEAGLRFAEEHAIEAVFVADNGAVSAR